MQNSYLVAFRQITDKDVGRECPFLPGPGAFELHIAAVAEDLSSIEGITQVSSDDDSSLIIETGLDVDTLKARLKPILQDHFCYLRISSIEARHPPPLEFKNA